MRLYDDPGQQAAFDRWVDLTAQLLQKYGPFLIKQLNDESEKNDKKDMFKPLELEKNAA